MTQEDKELLLQDLCARLPYGVKVADFDEYGNRLNIPSKIVWIDTSDESIYKNLKPYLRPMSSMTEEEDKEYTNIDNRSYTCPKDYAHIPASERIDWLNKNHFDYRGLIEKGLAIEVTEENNPYET